jgi:outer membrane protein assembly factor BamB
MKQFQTWLRVATATLSVATAALAQEKPADWPQWRGPQRTGEAVLTAPATWPATLKKRWEIAVGAGHSSPVIAGNRVVLHTRQGDREIVRAIDLATGKEVWKADYAAPYTVNPAAQAHGPGPKSTPVIADNRVVTLGISGILSAFDLQTGKLAWRVDAPGTPPTYGTAMSPAIDRGMVIVHMGGESKGALTAFDAATGAVRWRWTGDGPGYASPIVADIGGTRQVITQTQRFIVSVNEANGQLLWQIPFTTSFDQNAITPVVRGDLVIYSGLDSGTTAVRIVKKATTWGTEPAWKNEQVSMYMSSPVVSGGTLYGLSHRRLGQFIAIDLASGKTLWTTQGREGDNASLMTAGSLLLASTSNGELIVARINPARFEEVKRYTIAESAVWAHPAIAGDAIVVKDVDKLICWTV